MDQAVLTAVTRRALDHAVRGTTDLAPTMMSLAASTYTEASVLVSDRSLLMQAPQLVGYSSELPTPGAFLTKTVMGVPVVLTRQTDGTVRAFHNICAHRQARVVQEPCGVARRFVCPYHAWTYDSTGALKNVPGAEGFPGITAGLTSLPAADVAGLLWLGLVPGVELDVESHLGDLHAELASWNLSTWSPVGERVLDAPINWKLALDTFGENYHFATVHRKSFAQFQLSNCTVFDAFGKHHRLVFPMKGITALQDVPESQWVPLHHVAVIYAIHPNTVLSVTVANSELFRVYPSDSPGRSLTHHQNAAPIDPDDSAARASAVRIFEYAHSVVRDEDYALVAQVQVGLESGAAPALTLGRNEPGLQHRHTAWSATT